MQITKEKILQIVDEVGQLTIEENIENDIKYFKFHRERFIRMATTICERISQSATILDVGSHYLHSSMILKNLGFNVVSLEVSKLWDYDFIDNRRKSFSLEKIVENDLENLLSQRGISDKYDVILFSEILEHITFNPSNMWKSIYQSTKSGGFVYISTPNSFKLINFLRALKDLISLRRIGIHVNDIFFSPTYGHHWKEYSSREVKNYFKIMSDDFKVEISRYRYRNKEDSVLPKFIISLLSFIGHISHIFSDELAIIVHINKTGNWKISSPDL